MVASSSCEVEYIVAATGACQWICLSCLLGEILNQAALSLLYINKKLAIMLYKNLVLHDRSKHIDLHYHFIRYCVENGTVIVEFIGTSKQTADIPTKAHGRVRFQELRASIGIVDIAILSQQD